MEPLRSDGCRSRDRVVDPLLSLCPEAAPAYVVAFDESVRQVASAFGRSFDDAVDLMLDRAAVIGCGLGDLAVGILEGRILLDG